MLADVFTPAHHNVTYAKVFNGTVLFRDSYYRRPGRSNVKDNTQVKVIAIPNSSFIVIKGETWQKI